VNGLAPLREAVEKSAKVVQDAGKRHAYPQEACRLIGYHHAAKAKMIEFVEINAAKCGIPAQIVEQLRASRKMTEAFQEKACPRRPVYPVGDFWPNGPYERGRK
jgi:hypothetical protein